MLSQIVRAVCDMAGWSMPRADAGGRYALSLEGGLDFTLSSPDGDRLLIHAVLASPKDERGIPADVVSFVLSAAAGRFSRLLAVPALDPHTGTLVLYRFLKMKGQDAEALHHFVETFLNELAFWKAQPRLTAE
jgi:hypothetical protein